MPGKQQKQITKVTHNQPVSTFASADIILKAIQSKDIDVDKLEKLLEIKGKYEAKENEKKFQIEFANFQANIPEIPKDRTVTDYNKKVLYSYATLDCILKHIRKPMSDYGFSCTWSESFERDGFKRVYCHIRGWGHEQTNYVDIPIGAANKVINSAQQSGSSSTYGRRYSLIAALGITADEDDDGQGTAPKKTKPEPVEQHPEHWVKIREAAATMWGKSAWPKTKEYIIKKYKCAPNDLTNVQLEEMAKFFGLKVDESLKGENK